MPYEISKFGNGVAVGSGGNVASNVNNFYGARKSGGNVAGVVKTEGSSNELSLEFEGGFFTATAASKWLTVPFLLKGARITDVLLEVKEAFDLGGTTPAVNIGTVGSEATNGITASEAQLEAVGTYVLATKGTWTAPLAALTNVGITASGAGATSTARGRAEVIIRYDFVPA